MLYDAYDESVMYYWLYIFFACWPLQSRCGGVRVCSLEPQAPVIDKKSQFIWTAYSFILIFYCKQRRNSIGYGSKQPIVSVCLSIMLQRFRHWSHGQTSGPKQLFRQGYISCRCLGKVSQSVSTKPKMRASNILAMKHSRVFAISENVSVAEAITSMAVHNISSSLVINDKEEVQGIFTSRDLLRYLHYGRGEWPLHWVACGSSVL